MNAAHVELVHAHFGTNPTTVAFLIKQIYGILYSFTVHGPEEFDKPKMIALPDKIRHAAFVVAISSYGRSQLMRQVDYGQWHKINVVHCGLEKAFYDMQVPPVATSKKLLCIGRLCEQKAQAILVEAAHYLKNEGYDFHLTFAGDGPMRHEIEALITRYDLSDRITITGWVSSDKVRDLLLDCQAMVLPSFAEGLPVVLMEAMALARPVISSYVAGIPELVLDGRNGYLVAAGDKAALVQAMKKILSLPSDALKDMGERGRVRAIKRHNSQTEAIKLATLFHIYLAQNYSKPSHLSGFYGDEDVREIA